MAKATATCTCATCGAMFTRTKICRNRREADGWEVWAAAEDDSRTVMSLSVRADTADKARRAAAASGCSISEYVEHALLAQLGGDTDA